MVIILVILSTFISITVDYIIKMNNEKKREEKLLLEAIQNRRETYKHLLNY